MPLLVCPISDLLVKLIQSVVPRGVDVMNASTLLLRWRCWYDPAGSHGRSK